MLAKRSVLFLWPLLLASGLMMARPAAAQSQTFYACYVPDVGAMYLIKIPGLPANCLSASHVEISWTEGGTGEVADGSITTAKLADGAVTGIKIAEGAVTSGHIGEGAVTDVQIVEGAVTTTKLADGAVTSTKIAAGAVTDAQLGEGAVMDLHIAAGAVTPAKLADGAVTSPKIGEGAVSEVKIAAGAVTTGKLVDGAVTGPKLNLTWRSEARGISATFQNHVLQCQIGERVIAGGAELGADNTGFYIRGSHPSFLVGPDQNDGWRVQVVNTTGTFQDFTLWVLCAAP